MERETKRRWTNGRKVTNIGADSKGKEERELNEDVNKKKRH
jgi:hypothetical protein